MVGRRARCNEETMHNSHPQKKGLHRVCAGSHSNGEQINRHRLNI